MAEEDLREVFRQAQSIVTTHHNDVYYKFEVLSKTEGKLSCEVVHPVPPKILAKATQSPIHLILETPEVYERVTRPIIYKTAESAESQWIWNIFDGTKEQENVVLRTENWILTKDYKTDDPKQKLNFHFIAIVSDKRLKSLRDLTANDIDLLRDVEIRSKKAISELLGVKTSQIRAYLHYRPTFCQLHVHFGDAECHDKGVVTERAHLLPSVIQNLTLLPDYYKVATLTIQVKENDPNYSLYL